MTVRQWFSPHLPIANTAGLRDMAVLQVGSTATSVDLRSLFGGLGYGQKLFMRAEGAPVASGAPVPAFRAYFSFSPNALTVDETQVGPTGLAWPIEGGETFAGRFMGGHQVATGYATMTDNYVLNFKCVSPGPGYLGSGYLRLFRSSDDLGDTKQFRIPMPSGYGSPSYAPSGAWFPNT